MMSLWDDMESSSSNVWSSMRMRKNEMSSSSSLPCGPVQSTLLWLGFLRRTRKFDSHFGPYAAANLQWNDSIQQYEYVRIQQIELVVKHSRQCRHGAWTNRAERCQVPTLRCPFFDPLWPRASKAHHGSMLPVNHTRMPRCKSFAFNT